MKPILIAIIWTLAFATAFADTNSPCEAVMVEGMSISFTNSHGPMTVTAGKALERQYTLVFGDGVGAPELVTAEGPERRYTWAGDTRAVIMQPRTVRWYGSLGMGNGGAYAKGELEPWKEHDGINRYVVEEGQRHFTNETDAVNWIRQGSGKPEHQDYIYNDTGLVVGMDKQPRSLKERKETDGTLEVDVWQIYINGKKPRKLEGSKNASITVYYPPTYDLESVRPPAQPIDNYNQ